MAIEEVEGIQFQIEPYVFTDVDSLIEGEVFVEINRCTHVTRVTWHVAKAEATRATMRRIVQIDKRCTIEVACRVDVVMIRIRNEVEDVVVPRTSSCSLVALTRITLETNAAIKVRDTKCAPEADGLTAVVTINAAYTIAANQSIDQLVGAGHEALALAERQIVQIANDEVVRNILRADHFFCAQIVRVLRHPG